MAAKRSAMGRACHPEACAVDATLDTARTLIAACRAVVDDAVSRLARDASADGRISIDLVDREQVLAYDLSAVASRVRAAEELLATARGGLTEQLAAVWAGEVAVDLIGRITGREAAWGVADGAGPGSWSEAVREALTATREPALLEAVAEAVLTDPHLPADLPDDLEMARRTFREYAEERVVPVAERIHRNDEDIPDDIIRELAEMGCFGLSIPEQHGGMAHGGSEDDFLSMVVVTEELSRGSLGVAGSLITRPEILSKALVKGGTPEQQERWLPRIAAGELMCGVAVTEPDFGSDVAGLKVTAVRDGDAWVVNGTKTWCTFGGRAHLLMLLARTGTREESHRGLSLFVVEKPSFPGHAWSHESPLGGTMTARAIPTIGYRGMHSFEISFDGYRIPGDALVGGDAGLGKGFYLQVDAFANGRLQTAGRALGVMQAAFEAAVAYARQRHVFGVPLASYQLTRAKLARMAALIAACRAFSYRAAALLGTGGGQLEASMVKAIACLGAEWLTREAQQIHGGMGYAEEYAVSRYFVDARVLSIFEGADETLALRLIIRRLLEDTLVPAPA